MSEKQPGQVWTHPDYGTWRVQRVDPREGYDCICLAPPDTLNDANWNEGESARWGMGCARWRLVPEPRDSGTELTEQLRASVEMVADVGPAAAVRTFSTGATRDQDANKLDYEGFLSPLVLTRFAEYMHKNRRQSDGNLRASDNWQKGIPIEAYMKSTWRHFVQLWRAYRGLDADDLEESLCALLFNVQGYLHEHLKGK